MKKRKEKILSFMLAFLIIISSVHLPVFTAKAAEVTKDNDANETVDSIEEIEEEPIAAWPEEPAWISQDTKDLQQPDMEEGSFDHVIYGRLLQEMTENELIHCQNESNGIVEGEETTFANSVMMQRIAKDVTACIKYETQLYINGKKYTGGDIQVTKGDNVAYIHTWQPNIATGEMIGNGDWFEYTLFKIPNLNIASYSDPQPLMINGIRVGTWKLTYNKTTGEMRYRVTFNRYIQLFDLNTIRAKLQGSGSFSNASQGTQIEYNGQTNGLVIIERPAIQPSVPSGTGWRPPVPSFGTKIYKFGKGVKWNSSYDPTALPQIDWRVIFFDFLQKKQQEYLEGATISPTSGNCIIEENLDENQQFLWTNETRFGGSPFHLELPVITAGTDQLLNGGVGYGEVNGDYNGPGEINPYIRGADLIEVKEGRTAKTEKEVKAVQDEVRNRPCSWTVTTDPVTKKQTLLINLGVLGGTDSSKGITWDKVYRKNDWPEKGINSRITECENTIKALETGDNSPLTLLDQRHQAVVNKLLEVLKRPENADQATQMESELQLWRDNYRIWRSKPETTPLASLTAIPLPDSEPLKKLLDLSVDGNKTPFRNTDIYRNFEKSFTNLLTDQKTYIDNREIYKDKWMDARNRYVKTKEFYANQPIYGFALKVRTTSINTSMNRYKNQVNISIGDRKWGAENATNITFSNSITGNFGLGSIVLQKAEQCYDEVIPNTDEVGQQKQEIENIKKVEQDKAGIPGAKFKVYCEDHGQLVQTEEHLAYFYDREASANEDTYTYASTGSADKPKEAVSELVTDANGKLIIGGLSPAHTHYLVETEPAKGYYKDTTPIRMNAQQDKVLYDLVPNVSRSVKLKKIDSYSKLPVQGAEFVLIKKDEMGNETKLSGFSERSLKDKTMYVPDEKGTKKLLTNKEGELCIHNLEPGSYVLKEIAAADGYLNPTKSVEYPFTLKEELPTEKTGMDEHYHLLLNNGNPVKNDPKTASVNLSKMDGRTKEILPGAGFAVFRFKGTEDEWNKSPNQVEKWESVSFNDSASKYFKTKQKVITLDSLQEWKKPVQAVVTMGEESKDPIDMKGKLEITNIPLGHYSIVEVQAPDSYQRDYTNYYFDVTPDTIKKSIQIYRGLGTEQVEVTDNVFHNYQRKVFLKLVKGDARNMPTISGDSVNGGIKYEGAKIEGKGLSGAVYKLFMQEGSAGTQPDPAELKSETIVGSTSKEYDPCIAVGTTDENGILDLKDMTNAAGEKMTEGLHTEMYYMIEVKAPEGYVLDQDPISFRLDEKVFPTDQNGEIIETGTPGLVKRAENTKYEYGIRLIKKDSTDKKPLNRVGFTISKGNQEIAVKPVSNTPGWYEVNPGGQRNTMYTNTNGIVRINGLEPDVTYTIKETQIPKGYIKMDPVEIRIPSSKTGVIEESGHIYVEKEFLNQRALGKVILHKQDGDTGNALVGAKFQLYSVKLESISDNKVKRIETPIGDAKSTNEQGDLIFENLEWGQYCIRETDAPSGYVLSQEVHDFTIGKDSLREGDWLTVSFPHVRNQRQIGEAVLRKTDQKDSGKKLPNATFTLWKKFLDENGKEHWVRYGRDTRTTDENGEIKFRLPLGTYKVIEVAAPEGYLLPTGKAAEKEFVIQENAQDQNPAPIAFDIPNAPNLQKLKVEKKVTGAMGDKTQTFTFDIMLSHPNGTALNITLPYRECNAESQESMEQLSFIDGKATVKLSHNQSIMIENIPYGTHYEVKEREEGKDSYDTTYNGQKKIATGSMTLSNSGITEVIIENRRESVPDTGIFMNSSMGGMIAALGVLGVILLFIILSWKKRGK